MAGLALAGAAQGQVVDMARSSISATSKQMNVPVEGKFKKFSAAIVFDPAKPAAGSAHIEVDMKSYDLGDESFNTEVQGPTWFDAAAYPRAVFQTSAIVAAGDSKYSVTGKLTLKGKTHDVVVPVSVGQKGGSLTLDGVLPIKRSSFAIGTGEWQSTSVVSDDVIIKFHIVTKLVTKPH
jgi:polyisoprenoid-binding protein YceI